MPEKIVPEQRTDVQDAIHAPHIDWEECSSINVYVNGTDTSIPSGLSVLPNVIERSNRTVIGHGLADYVLIANGTRWVSSGSTKASVPTCNFLINEFCSTFRIMIQNMTFNGMQGFQMPIASENLILPGMGSMGQYHIERGLLYAEVALSGHMVRSAKSIYGL